MFFLEYPKRKGLKAAGVPQALPPLKMKWYRCTVDRQIVPGPGAQLFEPKKWLL
jgi:hypothetical protein